MRCYACGNVYIEHKGTLELCNKTIGNYSIYLAKYYKCSGCGSIMYPKETLNLISKKEKEIRDNLIRKLPVDEFIVATEAAELLGISKQAFHKNKRIKKGFIYSAILGGKRLYNKKSVQLFKDTNDGRFNLSKQVPQEEVRYVVAPAMSKDVTYTSSLGVHREYFWTKKGLEKDPPHYSSHIQ
jgi:hypothetical protein